MESTVTPTAATAEVGEGRDMETTVTPTAATAEVGEGRDMESTVILSTAIATRRPTEGLVLNLSGIKW